MEIVAHGLWTAAGALVAKISPKIRLNLGWTVWWGVFPDVLAFGPMVAAGLWMRLTGAPRTHVHFGLPLYPAGHSLIFFLLGFGVVSLIARRPVLEMLGWLLHILIDIPTHSLDYYATRIFWPISDFRIDGIAWWVRWFWVATYVALAVVYFVLWRKGYLSRTRPAPEETPVTSANSAVSE